MKKYHNKNIVDIAVFVSGNGTNLQSIIDAQRRGIIKHGKVELVLSNKSDAYAIQRAKENGIKYEIIVKNSTISQSDFEYDVEKKLSKNNIDLIVLAGFTTILSKDFISKYNDRIINIHPSLIPSFCGKGFYGLEVHKTAIKYGVKVTGATVHFVNEIPDGGKIILQKAVDVHEDDTPETLQKRVMREAEWIILPDAVEKVCINILKNEGVI